MHLISRWCMYGSDRQGHSSWIPDHETVVAWWKTLSCMMYYMIIFLYRPMYFIVILWPMHACWWDLCDLFIMHNQSGACHRPAAEPILAHVVEFARWPGKKLKNTKRKLKSVQMFSTKRDLELGRVFDLLIVNLFLTKTKMKSGKVNDPPAAAGLSMLTPPFKTSQLAGMHVSVSPSLSPAPTWRSRCMNHFLMQAACSFHLSFIPVILKN